MTAEQTTLVRTQWLDRHGSEVGGGGEVWGGFKAAALATNLEA